MDTSYFSLEAPAKLNILCGGIKDKMRNKSAESGVSVGEDRKVKNVVRLFYLPLKNIYIYITKISDFIYRGVMIIVEGNGLEFKIIDDVCLSHSTNTLGKGINSIIPPQAIGK